MNGLELKKKLKEGGFVLAVIARKMKMRPQNLNSILTAKEVKMSIIEKIAKATEKPIIYFIGEQKQTEEKNKIIEDDDIFSINNVVDSQRKIKQLERELKELNEKYIELLKEKIKWLEDKEPK